MTEAAQHEIKTMAIWSIFIYVMLCYRKYTLSRIKIGVILSENSVYGAKNYGFP